MYRRDRRKIFPSRRSGIPPRRQYESENKTRLDSKICRSRYVPGNGSKRCTEIQETGDTQKARIRDFTSVRIIYVYRKGKIQRNNRTYTDSLRRYICRKRRKITSLKKDEQSSQRRVVCTRMKTYDGRKTGGRSEKKTERGTVSRV